MQSHTQADLLASDSHWEFFPDLSVIFIYTASAKGLVFLFLKEELIIASMADLEKSSKQEMLWLFLFFIN